jgi:threonine dehydratase
MHPSTTDRRPIVTIEEAAAAATLQGIALRTPLVPFGPADRNYWLKAESLQPIGAFKIRGAYARRRCRMARPRPVTYSSGNHAQGVARAARLLGVTAIVMPSTLAISVRASGADGPGRRGRPRVKGRRRVAEDRPVAG